MKAAAAPETSHDTAPERQGGGRTEPETVATNPLWQLFAMGAQGKLTIGSPDDPLEDEADRVARQVVASPSDAAAPPVTSMTAGVQRAVAIHPVLQREEATPLEEEERLQRQAANGSPVAATDEVARGAQQLQGRGEPLSVEARTYFEPRFGADLGAVRIHSDGESNRLAQSVNAKAFTLGSDIVFDTGQYSPDSHAGKTLLAHELTHTLQQGAVIPAGAPSGNEPAIARTTNSAATIQRAPVDEKKYIINQVSLDGDEFEILLTHHPADGTLFVRITYVGGEDFGLNRCQFMIKHDDLKTPFDGNSYRAESYKRSGGTNPMERAIYFPYKDRRDINVGIEDWVVPDDKWVPPRRKHEFSGTVSGVDVTNTISITSTGVTGNLNTTIEVIPRESIPATVSEPEYKEIQVPEVPELSAKQALLAARISIGEILDNKDLYQLQMPEALELFKNELDTKLSGLDPSKDNGDAARLGTGIVRAADYFKQKVPSLALFLLPGYFPPSIEKEATRLVREAHSDYEVGLNTSNGELDKTNGYYKSGDHRVLRLQYRLANLFLKQSDGGLDALTEDITSLATNIYEYRSSAGVSPTFTFLDESVLGIRKQKVTGTNMTSNEPTPAKNIKTDIDALRTMHRDADLEAFTKVMQVASMARAYKSIFSMLAVYELLRFYRTGYYGSSSWAIDAVLPGSGEDTADGYIDSIGALLKELEGKFQADGGVTQEYLQDVLKRFTGIAGTDTFSKDLKFIVDRLNTIAKVKAVVKGLLVVIAAAIGAAIIGPAAGTIAAEAGLGVTGVGLVTFGAEVLSFTAISQLGDTLMFGHTEMSFFEELLHNAVTFGILKGIARVHRLAFAKFAEPKFYPKLFAATGAATSFVSLYGLGMVQHMLPPALGGKGRTMTAEEQGWFIVQNIALLGAMAIAAKITAPIREQFDERTFNALGKGSLEKLALLDASRAAIRDEVDAIRKLGVKADPVRRQRLINAIEQQFNSDIAWLKEALQIAKLHPSVLGVDKAKVESFIEGYRSSIDKLVVSMAENGYDFTPGGADIVRFVEPGVLAYTGDAFKTGDTDPLTGEKREVIDLGDGNFEVKVGNKHTLYVPQASLPVNVANPQGVRALVEYYKFDWETTKRAFGSDNSLELNSLLHQAWISGWRPGQPIPPEIQLKVLEHFRKLFDAEMEAYQAQVRALPEPKPKSEDDPTEIGDGEIVVTFDTSPFRVPGPITRGELLSDAGIVDEIKRFQRNLEQLLNKLNPDVRRGLVSLYVTKALRFLKAERTGGADSTNYPTSEELLQAAALIEKGGLRVAPGLIEALLTDREMLWLLFEFASDPKKLLEFYDTWRKKGTAMSFREYGRRFLFTDEFNRAKEKLDEHIKAEREAAKAQKQASSTDDKRSLLDRFGADWKTGDTEEDRAHNNALIYRDSEPSIIDAYADGKLPANLTKAMETALKGDHLSGIDANAADSYGKARTKLVGIVNLALKDAISSFADYLALIDLATQRAAIGRIGEGFTKALEVEVGLPGGGKKVTINLDSATIAAIEAARQADGLEPAFDPTSKWVTIDLFYDSGNLVGEVKVGTSYDKIQLRRYATLARYKALLAKPFKDAGIKTVDGIFYVVLPGGEGGSAATANVQERQARTIRNDAVSEGVDAVTTVRFMTRDGSLFEQGTGTTKTFIKTIK